jgi:tripartite motif-containing protein 2/3/tripartite motif-containing protein 71
MSTISDGLLAAQNPGNNSQIRDTKVSCAQHINAMNNELATLKKAMKTQKKFNYCIIATLVVIAAASTALSRLSLPFTMFNTYVSPKDCFATGRGLEMAVVGKQANAVLHTVDTSGKGYALQMETVACEFVSEPSGIKFYCNVKKVMESQYEVSYQATSRGRHQLHIKVEGEHIKGSPFNVTVIRQLGDSKRTITGDFISITVNYQTTVVGAYANISVFKLPLHEPRSFGSCGSGPGEFYTSCDLALDSDGYLLLADCGNHRIQKFRLGGKYITQKGTQGTGILEFSSPSGIAIHPKNGMVYVAETDNNRIQVLNQNLTFHKIFGTRGSGKGQFHEPMGIAFDSTGNIYVADRKNHRIQVLTAEGEFLRQIGKEGEGEGELKDPNAITVDSDGVVYVCELTNQRVSLFTTEGKFLTSLYDKEMLFNQRITPTGVAVDNKGIVYVVDRYKAIKLF